MIQYMVIGALMGGVIGTVGGKRDWTWWFTVAVAMVASFVMSVLILWSKQ